MRADARRALWAERVRQWRESGLSQSAFARQHGWPVRQAGYWIRQLRDEVGDALELIPVRVKHSEMNDSPVLAPVPAVTLCCASGWSVAIPPGQSAAWLADLLRRLA